MEAIATAIASLDDPESRRRVLQWVDDCFHTIEPLASETHLAADDAADLTVDGVDALFGDSSVMTASDDEQDGDDWFETDGAPADVDAAVDKVDAGVHAEPQLRIDPATSGPLDSLVRDLASDLQRFAEALQQPA